MNISNGRRWAALAVCCVANLLIALDMTVLHLAVPKLLEDLKPTATQFLWISDAYGFAIAGLLITMGNLGDRIGRKKLLLIGSAVFGLASVLTAYAPTPELLIVARTLLGMAAATLMPSTLSIIRNVFTDPKERTMAVGLWSSVVILGFGGGPVFGGWLLEHFWWGSVFLINVPMVLVVLIAGAVILPESRNPVATRLDPLSVLLSMVGLIGVVYTIKETAYKGIDEPDVIVAAVLGVGGLVWFLARQRRLPQPLVDISLFAQRAFSATVGTTAAVMFAQLALSLTFAQYFQLVLGWSPLKSGLANLPGMAGALVGGVLAGLSVQWFGRSRAIAGGLTLCAVSFLVLAQVDTGTPYWFVLIGMLISGVGLATTLTIATDTVLATVPRQRASAASAISETATELGGALGIALLGTLLGAVYRAELVLPSGLPPEVEAPARDSLGGAVAVADALPAGTLDSAREAFLTGMEATMYGSAALGVLIAVGALVTMRGIPKVIEEVTEEQPATPVAGRPG
ncbi:MFS transporter [Amycolatopsis suaedae]|uniref:MFS transporter n=1 Tax=Amycolatopsis suaedae TaxID=2510978 RepID=A0A4Q7J6W4_9PSEU|nr:MFS transporter [Amycolatopsis suaedae]RZQ62073.1 MFS transporter [Amycolatopsis suaedae]